MDLSDLPGGTFGGAGRGMQHHGLRRANERAVLRAIGFNPGLSNAEISRLCGLAPQTVSAILTNLEKSGLVERGEVLRGRRGQPATPFFLRACSGFAFGVEIGWDHVDVLLLDLHATVLSRRQARYEFPQCETVIDLVAKWTAELGAHLQEPERARLLDIGVAIPSNLVAKLQRLDAPADAARQWAEIDLGAVLKERTGLDVTCVNDGSAGCWGEFIALPQPRPANVVYLLASSFIGAGIVEGGALWEGAGGNAADLGAMLVPTEHDGPQTAHAIASVGALRQRLAAAGKAQETHLPAQWDWDAIAPEVDLWIADSAKALAQTVFNTATVVETGTVVIGTMLGDDITARLVERVTEDLAALPVTYARPPRILPGQLGGLAPAIGAAELALLRRHF